MSWFKHWEPDHGVEYWKDRAQEWSKKAERWEAKYEAEHQRIVDLALKHSPKLRASNEDGLPGIERLVSLGGDKQPEMSCSAANCPYAWPCPTYLWATGSDRFKVTIEATGEKS